MWIDSWQHQIALSPGRTWLWQRGSLHVLKHQFGKGKPPQHFILIQHLFIVPIRHRGECWGYCRIPHGQDRWLCGSYIFLEENRSRRNCDRHHQMPTKAPCIPSSLVLGCLVIARTPTWKGNDTVFPTYPCGEESPTRWQWKWLCGSWGKPLVGLTHPLWVHPAPVLPRPLPLRETAWPWGNFEDGVCILRRVEQKCERSNRTQHRLLGPKLLSWERKNAPAFCVSHSYSGILPIAAKCNFMRSRLKTQI